MVADYCKEGFTAEQLAAVLLKLTLKGNAPSAPVPRQSESRSDSRPSYNRERPSYDRERPSYNRERPSYNRERSSNERPAHSSSDKPSHSSGRPSYAPRERSGNSGAGEQRRSDNRFSKERSENTSSSEDRSHVKFRKRRERPE